MVIQKITKKVTFPSRLDMTPWVEQHPSFRCCEYDLHAVIQHCGSYDSKFAHYVACIHTAPGWYHFNDEKVTKATQDRIEAMEPYVLVYVAEQPTADF
jgi:ubiquitin C-terminal hydrolase